MCAREREKERERERVRQKRQSTGCARPAMIRVCERVSKCVCARERETERESETEERLHRMRPPCDGERVNECVRDRRGREREREQREREKERERERVSE